MFNFFTFSFFISFSIENYNSYFDFILHVLFILIPLWIILISCIVDKDFLFKLTFLTLLLAQLTNLFITRSMFMKEIFLTLLVINILQLVFRKKQRLVVNYFISIQFMLMCVVIISQEYLFWTKIINTLILMLIIFLILIQGPTPLIRSEKENEQSFNNQKIESKLFVWFGLNKVLTNNILKKFAVVSRIISQWLITLIIILALFCMILIINGYYATVSFKIFIVTICSFLTFLTRSLDLISKLDIRFFNILVKTNVLCCFVKGVQSATVRFTAFFVGIEIVKRDLPKTWEALNEQGYKNIDFLNKIFRKHGGNNIDSVLSIKKPNEKK